MCTLLKDQPFDPFSRTNYPGKTFTMGPYGKARANDDTFAVVYCEHPDGRFAVHLLAPCEMLTDKDEVEISVLRAWLSPAFLLCDRKQPQRSEAADFAALTADALGYEP